MSGYHYFPLESPFVVGLFLLLLLLFIAFEIGVLKYAYEKMGVPRHWLLAALAASLLGSYVNIPVAELPAEHVVQERVISFYGMRYVVPMVEERPATVVAVNLGGAVVPALLSVYLLIRHRLYREALLGVAAVAAVTHLVAEPVQGMGIAVPIFVPPLVAVLAAWAVSRARRRPPAPVAYIAGAMGTLVGADLFNLDKLQGLGAPVVSIGGAGTFDGIFLSGVLAALLA